MKLFLNTLLIIFLFSCAPKQKVDLSNRNTELNEKLNKGIQLFEKKKYTRALDNFNYIILNDRGSEIGLEARFYIGESSFELKEYAEAILSYEKFLQYSINDDNVEHVKYKICKSFFKLSTTHSRDQSNNDDAKNKIQFFVDEFPQSEYLEDLLNMLETLRLRKAEKVYQTGRLYLKIKEYDSAKIYFSDVIREYYDTIYLDEAFISMVFLYLLAGDDEKAKVTYEENQNKFLSPDKRQEAKDLLESYHSISNWYKNFRRLYL